MTAVAARSSLVAMSGKKGVAPVVVKDPALQTWKFLVRYACHADRVVEVQARTWYVAASMATVPSAECGFELALDYECIENPNTPGVRKELVHVCVPISEAMEIVHAKLLEQGRVQSGHVRKRFVHVLIEGREDELVFCQWKEVEVP